MNKTTTIIAMIGCLILGTAWTAHAQAPQTDTDKLVSVSLGGQFQSRSFSGVSTFTLFNETGTVATNQTVGNGFVFDASVGYRVWTDFAVAIGISTFSGGGEAAALAAIPDPGVFNQPTIKVFTADDFGDLSQTNIAVNFQIVYLRALTDRIDLAAFAGPSIIRVKQELASVSETVEALPAVISETETTGKAGTAGIDLSYRLNDRYGAGVFVRYLGGQADLPSAENLTVGGVEVGAGIRVRF